MVRGTRWCARLRSRTTGYSPAHLWCAESHLSLRSKHLRLLRQTSGAKAATSAPFHLTEEGHDVVEIPLPSALLVPDVDRLADPFQTGRDVREGTRRIDYLPTVTVCPGSASKTPLAHTLGAVVHALGRPGQPQCGWRAILLLGDVSANERV